MNKRFYLIFCLILALFPISAFSEDVLVTATYNKRQVQVQEEVQLTIKVIGANGNIQAPRLPAFKGFDTYYTGRASHLTFINNQSSSSVEFKYVLVGHTPGNYTLDPIEVSIGGKNYRTDSTQIEVTPGTTTSQGAFQPPQQSPYPPSMGTGGWQQPGGSTSSGSASSYQQQQPVMQEPPPQVVPDDDNIYVTATLDKPSVYPNEQVVLTYSLYTRYDTRYEGFEDEPQISGFWIEEFPTPKDVARETVRVNGKRYVKAEVKKIALFPTSAAEYTINPGSIKVSIRQEAQSNSIFDEFFDDSFFSGGGFFARRENRLLKPPAIRLNVRPLPEQGKPASFQGAVGNFTMQATIDKETVKQNEPVTLKLVIEGEGSIETLNKPNIPELKNFKIYDGDSNSQMFKQGNVIGGKKTFEVVFIPLEHGQQIIPSFEFSFFNPRSGQYQRLRTPEYRLNVTPGDKTFTLPTNLAGQAGAFQKEVTAEATDIRYIHEKIKEDRLEQVLGFGILGLGVANLMLTFLILSTLWNNRQESIFKKDVGLKRRRFAKAQAEKGLRKLRSAGRLKDVNEISEYFEEVERILTQFVADKFNLSTLGITRSDLERKLEEIFGSQDSLHKEVLELYKICDEARFARVQIPEEQKVKAQKILHEAIRRIDKVKV